MAQCKAKWIDQTTGQSKQVETGDDMVVNNIIVQNTISVKDKEVIVRGLNQLDWTLNFNWIKKAIVTFAVPFLKIPRVTLTMMDTSTVNAYVTNILKTGFTVNFQNNRNWTIERIAIERV